MTRPDFLTRLRQAVLIADGGMGTMLQRENLDLQADFLGLENCSEILLETRPDIIAKIHRTYLLAGAEAIETNTFGSNRVVLAEYDIGAKAYNLSLLGAQIARAAADAVQAETDRPRYVLGSIGPGTKLPSLGHIAFDPLAAAYQEQIEGLIAGGSDALIVETCQDLLQIKAAVMGARRAFVATGKRLPVIAQVTMETTGTMLLGTEMPAALAALMALPEVEVIGMNCATGPQEMARHVKTLSEMCDRMLSVLPNAGLPILVDGQTVYPLGAEEFAAWQERFVHEDGVNMVGGCCGTTPDHIAALAARLTDAQPASRQPVFEPSASSLYRRETLRQENAVFAIGERTNANGSKKFRELLAAEDLDGMVEMAKEQVREGSHAIDVCAAYVGRDELADMDRLMARLAVDVTAPIVVDSTEIPVIEAALKRLGGKSIVNSINLEDGPERARQILTLCREYGAAVVALTIDETGMAKTAARKVEIAARLYQLAVEECGLPPGDLLFDPLTFTICTGQEDDFELAIETLEGIRQIRARFPEVQIVLGLSNISFGLKAAARQALNSVFLHHAVQAGMTSAIIHVSKILPLSRIGEEARSACEAMIFNRRSEGVEDPLHRLMALYEDAQLAESAATPPPKTVEERLIRRIVDGNRGGIENDLEQALTTYTPLHIINELLLEGMRVVGELFGKGEMQLPFVLQSAQTMKAAVSFLEPHMEKSDGKAKGTMVLATVKGDVHDIGKNLVDIILTNNGFRVVNLGIKQPVEAIIEAARAEQADAVGMSGLLVKSTVIMKENLEAMRAAGLAMPVALGGAALTRDFVEKDCRAVYPTTTYARDAFDGLRFMQAIERGEDPTVAAPPKAAAPKRETTPQKGPGLLERPEPEESTGLFKSRIAFDPPPPTPPFWGARIMESIPLDNFRTYLNETVLFRFQWGFRKGKSQSAEDYVQQIEQEVRPILNDLLRRVKAEKILAPQAAYGFWPANGDGDDLVLFDPEDPTQEIARFALPRQTREDGVCLADFVRPLSSGVRDVVGLQVVTVGQRVSDVARQWFEADQYQNYLYLHGLGVEMTEALAEFVHARIRAELGYAAQDDRDVKRVLKMHYRGARYSFGYPACPETGDQAKLLPLLGGEKLGLSLGEGDQLHPEMSTSAIVLVHPQARYFGV